MAPPAWSQSLPAGVRLISVATEAEARGLADRIRAGESFDRLAREHSTDPSRTRGGYLGEVDVAGLRAEFRRALDGLEPGQVSAPVRVGGQIFLIKWLSREEQTWIGETEAGRRAVQARDYPEAERAFRAAQAATAGFPISDDGRLESLKNLADLYHLEEDYASAEPLLLELLGGIESPEATPRAAWRIEVLERLGLGYWSQGDYAHAETLYARAVEALETRPEAGDAALASALTNLWIVREARGDDSGAEAPARHAVGLLESVLNPEDPALARALSRLARLLDRPETSGEAEALLRRALNIFEAAPGPEDPDLLATYQALALVLEHREAYAGAQDLYDRLFGLRWPAFRTLPASDSEGILRRLVELLRLAPLGPDASAAAEAAFEATLTAAPPGEELGLALGQLLRAYRLDAQAETVLSAVLARFPESRRLHGALASLYVATHRMKAGLAQLEQATSLRDGRRSGAARERIERSDIYRRIGDLEVELSRLEKARAAYETAIELDPENFHARLGLGVVSFWNGQFDDALTAYARAAQIDPAHTEVRLRFAEAYLTVDRFAESVEYASRVLDADPTNHVARFIRMRGLLLLGRSAEARAERDALRRFETEARALEAGRRASASLRESARGALGAGDATGAASLYAELLETYPEATDVYFVLGSLLVRLNRPGEALDTFRKMAELGLDDFVVHDAVARSYEALGEVDARSRHRTVFLREAYAALLEAGN